MGLQIEERVEGGDAVDLRERDTGLGTDVAQGLDGEILARVVLLDIL